MSETQQSSLGTTAVHSADAHVPDTASPFRGVAGWLKFFVVVNLYVVPVLFVLQQIFGWIGIAILFDDYPGLAFVGLIQTGVSAFLVVRWIMISRRLRDIAPGVVQEAKTWLRIVLAWNVLATPLIFLSGMDAGDIMPGAIRDLFMAVIAFAIWYSYFNVSKRVRATYPDWRD